MIMACVSSIPSQSRLIARVSLFIMNSRIDGAWYSAISFTLSVSFSLCSSHSAMVIFSSLLARLLFLCVILPCALAFLFIVYGS